MQGTETSKDGWGPLSGMGRRLRDVAPNDLRGILDPLLDVRARVGLAFGVLRVVITITT
jgi:hypothetical protein